MWFFITLNCTHYIHFHIEMKDFIEKILFMTHLCICVSSLTKTQIFSSMSLKCSFCMPKTLVKHRANCKRTGNYIWVNILHRTLRTGESPVICRNFLFAALLSHLFLGSLVIQWSKEHSLSHAFCPPKPTPCNNWVWKRWPRCAIIIQTATTGHLKLSLLSSLLSPLPLYPLISCLFHTHGFSGYSLLSLCSFSGSKS